MGEPHSPGESPPDGTEQHQNENESILIRENNIPYDLDQQEYDQRWNEVEVGERDENGFTESLHSINSDFPLNEVLEHIDEIDLGIPFDGISEDNNSTDFHSLLNDGTSELIDYILSESEENHYFNSTANISNTPINSQQAINPISAATSPLSSGQEVIPEEEREDTWEIVHNPVSRDDLFNNEMSRIYASLPHSPDENNNTTMSSLNADIEVIADSNSFGDFDLGPIPPQVAMPCKKEWMPTTMGREPSVVTSVSITSQQSKQNNKSAIDLGIELPKPFQQYHQLDLSDKDLDTAFLGALGAPLQSNQYNLPHPGLPGISTSSNKLGLSDTCLDTALPGTSSQTTRLDLSDIDLDAVSLAGKSSQSTQLELSDTYLDTVSPTGISSQFPQLDLSDTVLGTVSLPGISSQSTQAELSATGLDMVSLPGNSLQSTQLEPSSTGLYTVSLPGISSQSTQLDLSDTGLQQTLLLGTSTSSLQLDLPSISVANQVGMVAMDVAVVTMVFPLPRHPSNLITWNNAGVLNDQAMKLPNLPSLEEKKRKRRESMKAASRRHRLKKKEKEDALINKEEQLLKQNSELRDKLKRLSQEKECYTKALKPRKEMHGSSKE